MYKKLALACALLHQPRVLLLDEPTVGVDPLSRRELWALLHEFVEEGMTVLLSTPYMDEAERCHRVALVHEGRLLLAGEPHALLADFAARPGAAANPTFESLFLASLEPSEGSHGDRVGVAELRSAAARAREGLGTLPGFP